MQHELANPLGMADRVGDRDGCALGNTKKGGALQAGRIDDAREVAHEGFKRNLADRAVGKSGAAAVVADQAMVLAETTQKL